MLKLKELRLDKQITQAELSKALQISASAIGMYEQGRRQPDYATLSKIASYFNVTTDYLLGLSDHPHAPQQEPPKTSNSSPHQQQPLQPLQPDTLTPEEASLVQAYRNANDRDKSIVDTILKPEVRAQSETVEETPMNTAERIGQKIINASPETQARVNAIIQEDVG